MIWDTAIIRASLRYILSEVNIRLAFVSIIYSLLNNFVIPSTSWVVKASDLLKVCRTSWCSLPSGGGEIRVTPELCWFDTTEKDTQEVVLLPDGFDSASQKQRQEVSWFTAETRTRDLLLTAGFSRKAADVYHSRVPSLNSILGHPLNLASH